MVVSGFYDHLMDDARVGNGGFAILRFDYWGCESDTENPAALHTRCLAGSSKAGMQLYMECNGTCARCGLEIGRARIANNFMVHNACSSKMVIFASSPHVWTNGPNYAYTYISIHIYE